MGNYPFFHNYKMFLRELYRLQTSNNLQIPLEVNNKKFLLIKFVYKRIKKQN